MKNSKNKYSYFIILIIILVVAIFAYRYLSHSQNPVQTNNDVVALPNISTPTGWYSWGTNHYPDYGTSTIPNSMTFGDQPINNSGNNTTTLIVVNAQNLSGKTDEQWIDTMLYPSLRELETPTSSMLWSVTNGRLILEAIAQTPAGGYDLYYYIFDNGAVYSFSLNPWYSEKNIVSSPDAQTLEIMVQNFTDSLPSSTVQ